MESLSSWFYRAGVGGWGGYGKTFNQSLIKTCIKSLFSDELKIPSLDAQSEWWSRIVRAAVRITNYLYKNKQKIFKRSLSVSWSVKMFTTMELTFMLGQVTSSVIMLAYPFLWLGLITGKSTSTLPRQQPA